jgi:hypothetical protein
VIDDLRVGVLLVIGDLGDDKLSSLSDRCWGLGRARGGSLCTF